MKRINYISALPLVGLAACLCLMGCSDEQLAAEALPLEIEATIPSLTKAITEKTVFSNGDKIAVTGGSKSANYQYETANSRWVPVSGSTPLTTSGGETFTAVWNPTNFTAILADQKTEGNYAKSNQLKATATATANLVQFRFAPAAAKLTIVVTYPTAVTAGAATITGNHLLDGTGTGQTITCYPVANSGKRLSFVALVYPETTKTYQISVVSTASIAETKTHKVTNMDLKAGYNYTYNFSTDNRALLILNSVTVSGFDKQPDTSVGDAT